MAFRPLCVQWLNGISDPATAGAGVGQQRPAPTAELVGYSVERDRKREPRAGRLPVERDRHVLGR
jgi:hypothetical protein